jgi:micrococcal nuclease
MKRRALVLFAIAALFGGYLYASRSAWLGLPVQVVCVIDGDTIKVSFRGKVESVRLPGIDCMETRHTGKQAKQAAQHGLTVAEKLRQWVSAPLRPFRRLYRTPHGGAWSFPRAKVKRDYFRRLLAYVEADGRDVGLMLIEAGLADCYKTRHQRRGAYEKARDVAKDRGGGALGWRVIAE